MSTRQKGNRAENEVAEMAQALGYATFAARGSRGEADLVAFEAHLHYYSEKDSEGAWQSPLLRSLVIQVGNAQKSAVRALQGLSASPRPIGSLCVVARRCRQKNGRLRWSFHTERGTFKTLAEAVEAQ